MKTKLFINLLFFLFLFSSCKREEAHIQLTNKVHNVQLDNISYGTISLGSRLLPGESTSNILILSDYDEKLFPMKEQISFYMVKGENRVYLKTKEYYQLDKDQYLLIEITDETEVINPLTQ